MAAEFELIRDETITEINSRARLYRHIKTGAQLLSIENDDENKVFGITFITPPSDATGLPHIMEHSVLCGSRKYPVKEPFVELLKGSLNTFLNAMTFPDKTTYPVASQNVKDFYNLIDVYLDAVFYPRITRPILQQEGWHYELENRDDPLIYKGVVFNEMKGAYSSPDQTLYTYTQQAVYPDNTYGVDSGGDPQAIPDLTYDAFKNFHDVYYHPSNSLIYFYGDDDPEERLRIIDGYLRDYQKATVDAKIELQPRWETPSRIKRSYDAGEDAENKSMMTVSWLLDEIKDLQMQLSFFILWHILIGTPASPLRKALIDSGLGEDLAGAGYGDGLRQTYFSTGLKGIASENADKIEAIILATLKDLAENGIDPDTVEASLNTTEFGLRENNTGPYPRGLIMMLAVLNLWLYGHDPIDALAFEAPLNAIKAKVAGGGRYFEALIRDYLLNNKHRVTLLLEPDSELRRLRDEAEKERLARAREAMSATDLEAVIENTRQLKLMQEAPDRPEDLAKIPSLALSDLDKQNKHIPLDIQQAEGVKLLYHDLFTNGIFYLDIGFDLRALPTEYLPYVGLFGQALLEMGTETEDFVKLSQRIGRKTGGIDSTTFISQIRQSSDATAWLILRGKSTAGQASELLAILRDLLLTVKLDDRERFRQIVLEQKATKESMLIPAGHIVINSRLASHLHKSGWLNEKISGTSYLFFLRELAEKIDKDWAGVLKTLETVRRHLITREAMLCNVTLDAGHWSSIQPQVKDFIAAIPAQGFQPAAWAFQPKASNEGLTIPAQVNYVGKAANLYDLGYKLHGSAVVITNFLNTGYLWERVRVQGGAYGGFCGFDQNTGQFIFGSYRDPNLLATLKNYDGAARFLQQLELNDDEMTKGIIGAIGQLDDYQLPDAKGYSSMQRHLIGYSDAQRQQIRDEILSTSMPDFHHFAEALAQVNEAGQVVVLGSQEAIEGANSERGGWLDVVKVL